MASIELSEIRVVQEAEVELCRELAKYTAEYSISRTLRLAGIVGPLLCLPLASPFMYPVLLLHGAAFWLFANWELHNQEKRMQKQEAKILKLRELTSGS